MKIKLFTKKFTNTIPFSAKVCYNCITANAVILKGADRDEIHVYRKKITDLRGFESLR